MPIVGTLDLHANLTDTMLRATNALIGYRTNPHLDQRDRGVERYAVDGKDFTPQRPAHAGRGLSAAGNHIERQSTSALPCLECFDALSDMRCDKRVLTASLLLGFPYADVREMGTSVLVVTDDDPDLAASLANDFAEYLRQCRDTFVGQLTEVEAAVSKVSQTKGPVCRLDGRQCRRGFARRRHSAARNADRWRREEVVCVPI